MCRPEKSIHFKTYIMYDDDIGRKFVWLAGALVIRAYKAREGNGRRKRLFKRNEGL